MLRMTEGNPIKLLAYFSIPMLIGNLFQQVYNLVDSIVVGHQRRDGRDEVLVFQTEIKVLES